MGIPSKKSRYISQEPIAIKPSYHIGKVSSIGSWLPYINCNNNDMPMTEPRSAVVPTLIYWPLTQYFSGCVNNKLSACTRMPNVAMESIYGRASFIWCGDLKLSGARCCERLSLCLNPKSNQGPDSLTQPSWPMTSYCPLMLLILRRNTCHEHLVLRIDQLLSFKTSWLHCTVPHCSAKVVLHFGVRQKHWNSI